MYHTLCMRIFQPVSQFLLLECLYEQKLNCDIKGHLKTTTDLQLHYISGNFETLMHALTTFNRFPHIHNVKYCATTRIPYLGEKITTTVQKARHKRGARAVMW